MLDLAGAVEAEWPDEGVAAHYGDPMREQRVMSERPALVDRSNRGVVKVTGPDRLSWLHSLTSQHLERLSPGSTQQALVLSPQGHLEHHLTLTDDGTATWIHVEPHTAAALVEYLNSMRFMLRVEVEDLTGALAVATITSPDGAAPLVEDAEAKAVMQGPFGTDLIVEPDAMGKLAATYPVAGLWAFEAARIAARIPRPGLDTDHRTLPHEIGLIEAAPCTSTRAATGGRRPSPGSRTSAARPAGSSSCTWTARWTGCPRTGRRSRPRTAPRSGSSDRPPGTTSSGRSGSGWSSGPCPPTPRCWRTGWRPRRK